MMFGFCAAPVGAAAAAGAAAATGAATATAVGAGAALLSAGATTSLLGGGAAALTCVDGPLVAHAATNPPMPPSSSSPRTCHLPLRSMLISSREVVGGRAPSGRACD